MRIDQEELGTMRSDRFATIFCSSFTSLEREQKGVARLIAGCCSVESGKRRRLARRTRDGERADGKRDERNERKRVGRRKRGEERERERVNVSDAMMARREEQRRTRACLCSWLLHRSAFSLDFSRNRVSSKKRKCI